MALSNKTGALLLTTGNKSELATGYCTLYGDMNGALAVIADVYKTLVYRVARWVNRGGVVIPESSIVKPPSAELRPDQTDQDSLPPYDLLDAILVRHVEQCVGRARPRSRGLRPGDGAQGAAPGPHLRVQAQAGGAGAEGDASRLRDRVADAHRPRVARPSLLPCSRSPEVPGQPLKGSHAPADCSVRRDRSDLAPLPERTCTVFPTPLH